MCSIVYMNKQTPLSPQEVFNILRHHVKGNISTLPATNPENGQVFLYSYEGQKHRKDDWRCDQYKWIQKGRHALPRASPLVWKTYFQRLIGREEVTFYRYGYEVLDGSVEKVIVHYLGEDKTPEPCMPHGNMRKYPLRAHVRTMPSVLIEIAENKDLGPTSIYQKIIAECDASPTHMRVTVPKNTEQIKNKLKYGKQKCSISHDDLYNIYELHYALEGFVCHYSLVPELIVTLALPDIINIFEEVMKLNLRTLISYDTTFQLGDFYLSPLIFQCSLFEENPAIPAFVLIHDKRTTIAHETFFSFVAKRMPQINQSSITIVTDREAAIVKSVENIIPRCKHVVCWNHILKDVEFWVSGHEGGKADRKVYTNNVLQLLDCKTEEDFLTLLEKLRATWSASFVKYFEEKLSKDILTKAGRWVLETVGIYRKTSGVTTNVSESMNAVMKRLTKHKEVHMDEMVLAIYFLQTFYLKEVLRGQCGMGNYHLSNRHAGKKLNSGDIEFPFDYIPVEKIVDFIKKGHYDEEPVTISKGDERKSNTMEGLADLIVKQNRVFLQAQSGCFIVTGLRDKKYVVKLFPVETCSCNSSRTCYHILAAQKSIGKSSSKKRIVYSLKKLRMNVRKGKSGRKRIGQKDELQTVAAMDSILMSETKFDDTQEDIKAKNKHTKQLNPYENVPKKEHFNSFLVDEYDLGVPQRSSSPKQTNKTVPLPWDLIPDYPRMQSVLVQNIYNNVEDMKSLLGDNWLVDTIIEGFLLTRASLKHVTECDVRVSVFSPFIIHSINLRGYSSSVHEFGIKSDIMAKDIWIIPTNVQNTHWVLMLVFMKWKIILYLNSNKTLYTKYINILQTFMDMQVASKIDWSKWTIHAPHDVPAQHDSSSCGLFLCLFAHILCSGSLVPFPADMTAVRQWIAMELISGKSFLPKSQLKKQKYCRAKKEIKQNIKKDFNTLFLRNPPKEATSTVEFLSTALDDYYTATWFLCFMGKLCKKPTKSKMILCQGLCQDWYHLSCLDLAHFPSGLYKCPKCI